MTRLLLILIALLALVAGCGEGGGESDDPLAALDTAVRKTTEAESYRHEFTMESTVPGQEMSMSGGGTSNADSTEGRMTFTMESSDGSGNFDYILNGGQIYIRGDDIPLPDGKEWLKQKDESPVATMSPSEFVRFLSESGEVTNEGTEEIRGEETVHFRGPVDMRKLMEETESGMGTVLKDNPMVDDLEAVIDIWVGPDGLPARMILDLSAPEQGEGSLKITSDVLEYNVDVNADPPPASKVFTP